MVLVTDSHILENVERTVEEKKLTTIIDILETEIKKEFLQIQLQNYLKKINL